MPYLSLVAILLASVCLFLMTGAYAPGPTLVQEIVPLVLAASLSLAVLSSAGADT